MSRGLHLFACDMFDPKRLRRIRRYLTGFKVGGQRSVFECWVTAAELRTICGELFQMIAPEENRVHVAALDPRMNTRCFGVARTFAQPYFTIP